MDLANVKGKKIVPTNSQCNELRSANLMEKLLLPENALMIFLIAIIFVYVFIPLNVAYIMMESKAFGLLASLSVISFLAMLVGNGIPLIDNQFISESFRINIKGSRFVFIIWSLFFAYIFITILTASSIPFISAISGADANEVSQQRGDFLKGRQGWASILIYISTFMSTFVPYAIVVMYERSDRLRHIAAFIFVLYGISFMAKTLFLYAVLPIFVFLAIKRLFNFRIFILASCGIIFMLIGLTYISLREELVVQGGGEFFSASYVPSDSLSYFIWRSVGVPVFTAVDTLLVHQDQFNGKILLGATSNFISSITGIERINLERIVFEHQFGSWNEIANANAVFITDAFVNFDLIGLILISIFVGQVFRWFKLSHDIAFKAQWINFAFMLFSASFIGVLLSNCWLLMLFMAIFVKVEKNE